MKTLTNFIKKWNIPILVFIFFAGFWEVSVRLLNVPNWLLPSPYGIMVELYNNIAIFSYHSFITIIEILIGFIFAVLWGLLLAFAVAYSKHAERIFYPFIIASQTIPIIVLAPILLIWFGYGLLSKIIVVALISFFPIVVNLVDGFRSTDVDKINLMRTLGATKITIFRKLAFPSALPFLFSGLRVAVAVSVIGAVVAEWIGSSSGLGYLMIRSKAQFLTERIFASILILSFIGIFLFIFVSLVERIVIPWNFIKKDREE